MAMHLVDQLLNLLTHQQHSRTTTAIANRRRLEEEEERISALLCPPGLVFVGWRFAEYKLRQM